MKRTFNYSLIFSSAMLLFATSVGARVQASTLKTERLELSHRTFTVEVATNQQQWAYGLMFRTHMAADHGMLFAFPDSEIRSFWMKNTLIPLDMLFFDADRKLINIAADVPSCKADPCATYSSTAPAKYVLELNGGVAAKLGIKAGDSFSVH